jgi:hypothetical protein
VGTAPHHLGDNPLEARVVLTAEKHAGVLGSAVGAHGPHRRVITRNAANQLNPAVMV